MQDIERMKKVLPVKIEIPLPDRFADTLGASIVATITYDAEVEKLIKEGEIAVGIDELTERIRDCQTIDCQRLNALMLVIDRGTYLKVINSVVMEFKGTIKSIKIEREEKERDKKEKKERKTLELFG